MKSALLLIAILLFTSEAKAADDPKCGVPAAEKRLEVRADEIALEKSGFFNRLLVMVGLHEKPKAPVAALMTPQAYSAMGFGLGGGMKLYQARGDYEDVGEAVWIAEQALRDNVAFENVRRELEARTLESMWAEQAFDASFLTYDHSVQLLVVSREMYRRLGKEEFKKFVDFLRVNRDKGDKVWQMVFNSAEPGTAASNPRNVRKIVRAPASVNEATEDFVSRAELKGVSADEAVKILEEERSRGCGP